MLGLKSKRAKDKYERSGDEDKILLPEILAAHG